tara:strand:- start:664 stop:783 length:120 start_codon:yes stop_codon:yes gene_type:complete
LPQGFYYAEMMNVSFPVKEDEEDKNNLVLENEINQLLLT